MTDVLIAGGGPAGSSLAIGLGRAGYSVELHEKSSFPRDKPCGEGLMPAGVAALDRLGLRVEGAEFLGIRYHHEGLTAEGWFPKVAGMPEHGLCVRRLVLDRALFGAAARTPGVRAFEGSVVEALVFRSGAVCGARVNRTDRPARLVVAADGVHSRLRRLLGLEQLKSGTRYGLVAHFGLASGVHPGEFVDVYLGKRHEVYVGPLPGRELLVAMLAWRDWEGGGFMRTVSMHPRLAGILRGAKLLGEIKGVSPLSGEARARAVPGCVLLGDAAGFTDAVTGGGMTQALLSAELLAAHLQKRFSADVEDLLVFDRARQRMLADYRRLTAIVLAAAARPFVIPAMLRVLKAWPGLFSHAVGVSGGMRRLF